MKREYLQKLLAGLLTVTFSVSLLSTAAYAVEPANTEDVSGQVTVEIEGSQNDLADHDEVGDGETDGEVGGETGDGETGGGETGDGETGDGEIGGGETGDGETGDGEIGDGETGDGETGDGEVGAGEIEDGETGSLDSAVNGGLDELPIIDQEDETVAEIDRLIEELVQVSVTVENTGELRERIQQIRMLYEQLSEEQKGQTTSLSLLSELEEEIARVEAEALAVNNDPEISIPQETCTVDYREQSDGVTYAGYSKDGSDYVFHYVIEEGAEDRLVVDLTRGLLDVLSNEFQYPGDRNRFKISILNRSGNTYDYRDGSFVLTTADTDDFGSLSNGGLLPVLGYDGQYLPIRGVGSILPVYIAELYGKTPSQVTFADVCNIYNALSENGYSGDTAISDYMLDYLNGDRGTGYGSLEEMFDANPAWGDGVLSTSNGIFELPESYLLEQIEAHPWIDRFLYVQQKGDKLRVQVKWPEAEMAAVTYDAFYNGLFSFAFGEENVERLKPNGSGVSFTRDHAVGDYQPGAALWEETDRFFAAEMADGGLKPEGTIEIAAAYALDGPGIGNGYQNFEFSAYCTIELERIDTSYTVRHEYYTSVDGGAFKKDGEHAEEPVAGLVGDKIDVLGVTHRLTYVDNTYEFKSVTPAEKLTLLLDEGQNMIVLRYEREDNTTPPVETPEPTPPVTPTTPVGPDDDDDDPDDRPRPTPPPSPAPSPSPEIEVPAVTPPQAPEPETEPPAVEIAEPQVPLAPAPAEPEEDLEVVDMAVPQGNLPQTGIAAPQADPTRTCGMLALGLSLAAAGLAVTIGRKKEDEN